MVLILLGYAGLYDLDYAISIINPLLAGLQLTIVFTAVAIAVGFSAGLVIGSARTSHSWFARAMGATYVDFFRSMPPIVLVFFSFIIAVLVGRIYLSIENPFVVATAVAVFALALHSGAYQAEIIRAGILSVPAGQVEAAEAIGLGRAQIFFRVVLPQAFRVSLPALGNEFASVTKDTSLLAAIGALELFFQGQVLVLDVLPNFSLVFVILAEVALLYFAVTFTLTRVVRGVENRFKVPGLEAAEL